MRYCYFAADVEGGSARDGIPPHTSMASLAVCVIGRPEEYFYAELQEIDAPWDSEAEKIHGMSREYLRQHGKDPRQVMTELNTWTRDVAGDAIAVFCAMPITYDYGYVDRYFRRYGIVNPFTGRQDGRELFRRIRGLERHEDASRARIYREFPTSIPHIHHGLSDTFEYEEVHGGMLRAYGSL